MILTASRKGPCLVFLICYVYSQSSTYRWTALFLVFLLDLIFHYSSSLINLRNIKNKNKTGNEVEFRFGS